MKFRVTFLMAIFIAAPSLTVSAQVLPLGSVNPHAQVDPASCSSCGAGPIAAGCDSCSDCGGTVWGTHCMDCNFRPGLYPPCPNPCRTTLLTDIVCGVKGAVDTSLSHLFCCLLGGPTFSCGCVGHCTCEPTCGAIGYGMGCDDCGDGLIYEGPVTSPTPARPSQPGRGPQQPVPAPTEVPADPQPDPFTDDPRSSQFQPIPHVRTSAQRAVDRRRSVGQKVAARSVPSVALGDVQPIAYHAPSDSATDIDRSSHRATSRSASSGKPTRRGHYRPRRETSLRTSSGDVLRKTPVRATGNASPAALRFR